MLTPAPEGALDDAVPAALRERVEQRYWAPIGDAAALERFIDDPALHAAPDRHPALFSDHGVVHVRDIAASAASLAARAHGVLLPARDEPTRQFVRRLAVLLAYFHDIGMVDPTPAGRRVHPQFAAQTVLGAGFDELAHALWHADAGGLRSRLASLPGDPRPVAREAMALALAHSKSAVPAPVLDDPAALRALMQRACLTDLQALMGGGDAPSAVAARYAATGSEPFAWLVDAQPAWQAFTAEVIDAVRILRAADALRQRGTTLRTSAGYEICTDRETGEAVVGLRTADQRQHLLLRFHNPISAAEANIRSTMLADDGSLCVEFWRGSFVRDGVRDALLAVTADVIADIEADALGSFAGGSRQVRLAAPDDDPHFADEVAVQLAARHARLAGRLHVVPAEPEAPCETEAAWAGAGHVLEADEAAHDAIFERLAAHGLNVDAIDRRAALAGTRRVRVEAGRTVIEPGSRATFVVVPLEPGLELQPTGGWPAQPLHPWIPLGVTGVVRGGERNAGVVARQAVDLLLIGGEHYVAAWFRPYDLAALRARLRGR